MKTQTLILALVAAGLLAATGYGLYRLGMTDGMKMASPSPGTGANSGGASQKTGDVDPATGRKILYWHDPMKPEQKFDKPGKSPFMDMQLVPVYASADGDEGKVTISARVAQNLGVRTAQVTTGSLTQKLEAVGNVAYNERDVAVVTARANGYVERLHVRAPLDRVTAGQALAEVFVPDWVAAQEEYLSVRRMRGQGIELITAAARQRMLLAGMSEDQVRLIESAGAVRPRFTLTAPVSGVITELAIREGMTVMQGAMLFRINGLGSVWVNAEIPESRTAFVRPGSAVEARTPALPERKFKGRVAAILPDVNPTTRTLKARIEVANPGAALLPGMFANIDFMPVSKANVLLVPSEAVIQTGERKVVILAQEGGKFQPVDVETGADANGLTEIRKGLAAGQKVVVSGQFLIDSEASFRATTTRMSNPPGTQETNAAATHHGEGRVERIGKEEVTLSHGPIASLQWGAMTMGFKLPAQGLPKDIAVGDTVAFEIRPTKDGAFEIASISRTGAAAQPVKGTSK